MTQGTPGEQQEAAVWSVIAPITSASSFAGGTQSEGSGGRVQDQAGVGVRTEEFGGTGPPNIDQYHDGLLFLKIACLLLVILGIAFSSAGLTSGLSQVTLAPSSQDNTETICGTPFAPAKEGDPQPGDLILNRRGEGSCRESIGFWGNISVMLTVVGGLSLIAGGVFGYLVKRWSRQPYSLRVRPFLGGRVRLVEFSGRRYIHMDDLAAASGAGRMDIAAALSQNESPKFNYYAGSGTEKAVFADIAALPKIARFIEPNRFAALQRALT